MKRAIEKTPRISFNFNLVPVQYLLEYEYGPMSSLNAEFVFSKAINVLSSKRSLYSLSCSCRALEFSKQSHKEPTRETKPMPSPSNKLCHLCVVALQSPFLALFLGDMWVIEQV